MIAISNASSKIIVNCAKKFCAYRERCQKEMRLKLKKMGASSIIAEQVITELIVSGFVNEQRFALSFCSGKFRHNSWGKVRIIQELQKREISSKCIEVAINEIVEEEYLSELKRLITLKLKERNKEGIIKKNRTDGEPNAMKVARWVRRGVFLHLFVL